MKKRTFFAVLILFLVFLNSMILIASLVILNSKLSAVRERCLAEHYVIASSLIGDMQALEQRGIPAAESIDRLMRTYLRYLQGKEDGLAVAFSGEWIYRSALPREVPALPPDTGHGQERWSAWRTGLPPCCGSMAAFRPRGRTMGSCTWGTWMRPSLPGAIRRTSSFWQGPW